MKVYKDFSLSEVLWYKIGGRAHYLLEAYNEKSIEQAFAFIEKNHITKVFIVGLGSNLLFTDEYYDGAVIRIVSNSVNIKRTGDLFEAYAGEVLDDVIQFSFQSNTVGLEWAGGLPGTIGAAVRGNVGAFGGEIKDSFHSAKILEWHAKDFQINTFNKNDLEFSYRTSIVKTQKNFIIVSASFFLYPATPARLRKAQETYYENIEYRKKRHPMEYPSNGSAFKNIHTVSQIEKVLEVYPDIENKVRIDWHGKVSVGYLIKRLGLSGFRIGGAEISDKHANFIVNRGGARFTDVLGIIKKVQDAFYNTFGFIPEPEVEIVQ